MKITTQLEQLLAQKTINLLYQNIDDLQVLIIQYEQQIKGIKEDIKDFEDNQLDDGDKDFDQAQDNELAKTI